MSVVSNAAAVAAAPRKGLEMSTFDFSLVDNSTQVTKRALFARDSYPFISCNNKGSQLKDGQRLNVGDCLVSGNGDLKLMLQNDGNIVLYLILVDGNSGYPLWSTNTGGKPISFFIMQGDGNLVAYDKYSKPYWDSKTTKSGASGRTLIVQDDWNLVIYERGLSRAAWDSGTGGGKDATSWKGHSRATYTGYMFIRLQNNWTAKLWSFSNVADASAWAMNKDMVDMTNGKSVLDLDGKYAATTKLYASYGIPVSHVFNEEALRKLISHR